VTRADDATRGDEPEDARFEDGAETALRLRAETDEDLAVISALAQDALASVSDIAWAPKRRRFSLLLRRFRWEDAPAAERQRRPFERVQSVLTVGGALKVRASGVDPRDRDTVIAVLAITFAPTEDGAGVVRLALAGDGDIAIEAECLDVTLADVSRPYLAQAKRPPEHGDA
jgi:hypothetical protein